ncbi:MAG UNVERIFIED_CONTAM: hypothetical protein MIN83_12895 [Paenibacillus polymyxa]|uniref:hypothetical protein n=2 Tax=Paenibacillus polymyxa TaxID=1406 RepID=UPI001D7CDBAD|nr:hypothetical protein [Paenibacillus polymyxa]MBZ6443190.1 hypothetical protein [Paenibacillus polymyxa]MBZ6451438.1 hypothetical protein [Paenibacillus polymyxa]
MSKYLRMKTLITDVDLLAAALTQARVTVYEKDGHIADYGGVIEKYTPESVKISGTYFMREIYVFKTEDARKKPE